MTDGGAAMTTNRWIREFPEAVTVCDTKGTILEMTGKAAEVFAGEGGDEPAHGFQRPEREV